jgi:hypothetical protein
MQGTSKQDQGQDDHKRRHRLRPQATGRCIHSSYDYTQEQSNHREKTTHPLRPKGKPGTNWKDGQKPDCPAQICPPISHQPQSHPFTVIGNPATIQTTLSALAATN